VGLYKSIKKKLRSAYESTKDFKHGMQDRLSKLGGGVSDAAKRTGIKAKMAYRRYKDPLIIGTGAVVGGILGSVVPVIGTAAGAALGGSLAAGAVGANKARKEEKEVKKAEKAFAAQTAGLEASQGGLSMALRRRRLQRGAGEAVASYESDTARGGIDEQEIAA
jgi:hypothetical protein